MKYIFFYANFFSMQITNSESEIFKHESQISNNFFKNGKTKNIFILSLLFVYYICMFITINILKIHILIYIEKRILYNSTNINFKPEIEISIEKKLLKKKIFFTNLALFLSNFTFYN